MKTTYFKNIAVVSFIVIAWGYIGYLFYTQPSLFFTTTTTLYDFFQNNLLITILLIGLCGVNWGLEALKWHKLLLHFENSTYLESYKSVLKGLAWSLIIPRTLGDAAGRLQNSIDRKKSITSLLINKVVQFSVTIFFGLIGLWILGEKLQLNYLRIIAITIFGLLVLIIIFQKRITQIIPQNYRVLFQTKDFSLFIIGALRYIIFISQYALVIFSFNVSNDLKLVVAAISVIYLVKSIVFTSNQIGDLGIRESTALFILGALDISDPIILASGLVVWGINILLPSLVGTYILLTSRK